MKASAVSRNDTLAPSTLCFKKQLTRLFQLLKLIHRKGITNLQKLYIDTPIRVAHQVERFAIYSTPKAKKKNSLFQTAQTEAIGFCWLDFVK